MGNFDGVHLGHQAMLQRLRQQADKLDLPTTVMTFEPHPRELFSPGKAPARLTSLREKINLLSDYGVDRVHVCHFDHQLATQTAQDFIRNMVQGQHQAKFVLVGDDFRFGNKRLGDFALLQKMQDTCAYRCEAMSTIEIEAERVSSSAVRRALGNGELEHANKLLGRPYNISGRVSHGDKIGQSLGFPTLNLPLKHRQAPFSGVFAVIVKGISESALPGAANLGVRPTIAGNLKPLLEVHLLNYSGVAYGKHVQVYFLHKLRPEKRFANLRNLRRQIAKDVVDIQEYFTAHPISFH